jgi:hypothetical protein
MQHKMLDTRLVVFRGVAATERAAMTKIRGSLNFKFLPPIYIYM